jgi:putative transposase
MVSHPAKYPWSSYQKNASGKAIELITPHSCYLSLGNDDAERQHTYQSLFESQISTYTLKEIREATNKGWILGKERFKKQIEIQTGRRVTRLPHGGDRKSVKYKDNQQLRPFDCGTL